MHALQLVWKPDPLPHVAVQYKEIGQARLLQRHSLHEEGETPHFIEMQGMEWLESQNVVLEEVDQLVEMMTVEKETLSREISKLRVR